jgi:AAA domain
MSTASEVPESPSLENKLAALAGEMKPAQLSDADFRCGVLLYADPGGGKTDLGIKIANLVGSNICLLYTDRNWTTILKYPEITRKVTRFPFGGLSQIKTILDARDAGIEPYVNFDTLMWDTTSTGISLGLRNLVTKRKFPKDQYAPDLEGRPHYRLIELQLQELCERINRTDLHMIYTAHLRYPTEQDVKQGKISLRPAMPEASFRVVAQHANMIGYLHKRESGGQRYIQLSGTEQVVAKCQIPNIEEKTYPVERIPQLLEEWLRKG